MDDKWSAKRKIGDLADKPGDKRRKPYKYQAPPPRTQSVLTPTDDTDAASIAWSSASESSKDQVIQRQRRELHDLQKRYSKLKEVHAKQDRLWHSQLDLDTFEVKKELKIVKISEKTAKAEVEHLRAELAQKTASLTKAKTEIEDIKSSEQQARATASKLTKELAARDDQLKKARTDTDRARASAKRANSRFDSSEVRRITLLADIATLKNEFAQFRKACEKNLRFGFDRYQAELTRIEQEESEFDKCFATEDDQGAIADTAGASKVRFVLIHIRWTCFWKVTRKHTRRISSGLKNNSKSRKATNTSVYYLKQCHLQI